MPEKKVLYAKVSTAIQKIEQRRKPSLPVQGNGHFTWRFPKYHDGTFEMYCPCGETFKSYHLDMLDLVRLFTWQNEHCDCEPKHAE